MMSRYEQDLNEREEANQRFALGDKGYRLFKAAPDLLDALGRMLVQFEANEQYDEDDATVIEFARRIYNQAKGRNDEKQ